jgi:molecular chaperone GrpE
MNEHRPDAGGPDDQETAGTTLPEIDQDGPAAPGFTVHDRRFWNLEDAELEAEEQRAEFPSYVEQLRQQLEEKDRQLREYIAAYKQEVVEGLEKTKQRLERDAAARVDQVRGELAQPMMEVLDALERSLTAAESSSSFGALLQGVQMVHLLMVQKLQSLGLTRVEAVGRPFDPSVHEAVAVAPVSDPTQDNVVVAELKPGFTLGDRLVRPAQVQVGKLQ